MGKFCGSCGAEVLETAVVCMKCGSAIDKDKKVEQPTIIIQNNNSNVNGGSGRDRVSNKSKPVAALLCFFLGYLGAHRFFLGYLGVHRFYIGKVGTGVIYLLTLGVFGIGTLIDFFVILFGNFRDSYGDFLKH